MKKILLLAFQIGSFALFAQQNTIRCYTKEVMNEYEKQHPGYNDRVNHLFDEAKRQTKISNSSRSMADTVYKIRVVFHVVYTTAAENIPDSFIYSQIEILNEDYRRKNADTSLTRTEFLPVAADAGIEFELASQDPNGNFTTGITRTLGSPTGPLGFTPFADEVKSAAKGGKDPWPTDQYLNIWVCNILNGFGVLGYAFPPNNAPNWTAADTTDAAHQGVVLHYPVVGRNNTSPLDPTVAQGRSAVHEIGHYLGLRHIWGDGDCTVDDGLDDTPTAAAANQQTCNYTTNSCTDTPVDHPDMLENYMDYSDDRCLNMFTKEQVGVMRWILQTSRAGIVSGVDITYPAAINNIEQKLFARIYPNPTQGKINISHDASNASCEVFDIYGKEVKSELIRSEAIIDISNLADGIYTLKLKADQAERTKKIYLVK